jgi:hypothetical protein
MGATLFGRTARLTLGTTQIDCIDSTNAGLALTFHIKKNLKPEPNSVEIKVWNLAPNTRKSIETPKTVPVKLEVGYGGDLFTIYLGELHSAQSARQGADIVTSISSGDKEAGILGARTLIQVPASASPQQLLQFAAQGLTASGIGLGNLNTQTPTGTTGGPARTLHGVASNVFGQVCRANGLEWSVQDGALQVLPIGSSLGATAVRLNADSGMLGSPTVDTKGILTVKSLIQPDLMPGRPLIVEAAFLQGAYRIEEVEFVGDTWGTSWEAQMKCRKWQ